MVVSLRTHLLEPHGHGRLPFHPDCPHCRPAPTVLPGEPRRPGRAATSRTALAATLLAGSALSAAAAVPVAQAQVEEETEGTEDLDGSGDASPEFEEGPEDLEAEREESDVLIQPPDGPDPLAAPDDGSAEHGPGSTAPGVLNAPPPAVPAPPPPAPPLPPPPADERADQVLERPLGQQPTPPELRPRAPLLRSERRSAPDTPDLPQPSRESNRESDQGGASPPAGPPLQPLPAGPGPSPLGDAPSTAGETEQRPTARDSRRSSPAARAARASGRLTPLGRTATYRVRPGDSLWSIAEAQLGPAAGAAEIASRVGRLWNLNGTRIGTGDPDLVMPGTVLLLR